jgi:hypothetical protein
MIFSTQNTSPLEMDGLDLVPWGEPGRLAGPATRHRSPHHHPPPPQRLEALASGWRQQQLPIPWLIKSIEASPETIASRRLAVALGVGWPSAPPAARPWRAALPWPCSSPLRS